MWTLCARAQFFVARCDEFSRSRYILKEMTEPQITEDGNKNVRNVVSSRESKRKNKRKALSVRERY